MSLDVHLHGERIGTLISAGDRDYRFAYAPEAVARKGAGSALLSTSLPVQEEPFSAEASGAYFENLLPEGRARARLCRAAGLDPDEGYELLAVAGRDCAGAVVCLPEGEVAGPPSGRPEDWLAEEELAALAGRAAPELEAGFCLPGSRHKLALVGDAARGRWALPTASLASTHVIKPESGELPDLVRNEMFCMEVARNAGLPVAPAELREIGGRSCLVSRRFDREGELRVHCECFTQALGFPTRSQASNPAEAAGPGFSEAAGLLNAIGRQGAVSLLLSVALFNYMIGNGDAHGGNLAVLHEPAGSRLAPFYDLSSTVVYDLPEHVGLMVNEDYDQAVYLLEMGWISEECDFDFDELRKLAATMSRRVRSALDSISERARREGWHAPVIDDIVGLASERASGLGFEVEY